jgi:hypothetical protein
MVNNIGGFKIRFSYDNLLARYQKMYRILGYISVVYRINIHGRIRLDEEDKHTIRDR